MSKNKFVRWLISTWIVQAIMYRFGGWCFVRKSDGRFPWVSSPLRYEGDQEIKPGHHPKNWKTWVCIQVPVQYFGVVNVAFDVFSGQRLALLGKEFRGGDMIAFKVGHEPAEVRFVSRDPGVPPPPNFIGRWVQGRDKVSKEDSGQELKSSYITYI